MQTKSQVIGKTSRSCSRIFFSVDILSKNKTQRCPDPEPRRVQDGYMGSRKGSALITTIIILSFLAVLGLSLVTFLFSRFSYISVEIDRMKAIYLAEAGIAKSICELKTGVDTDDDGLGDIPKTDLAGGAYKAKHDFQTQTIEAVGSFNDVERTVQIRYSSY